MDIGRAIPADLTRDLLAEVISYKALYDALCKLVQSAVIELDENARIVRWNLAAEALTGHAATGASGRPLEEFLTPQDASPVLGVPVDGAVHEVRFSFAAGEGKTVDVRGHCLPFRGTARTEGWLLVCDPARRLDEIEQLKNEFVSTISHELKTPLAAIKAYSSTLLSNPGLAEGERSEYLSIIDQQTDRLSRLIDDLLLVTRVETGQMLKRRVRLSLESVLRRVTEELAYDPNRHTIELDAPNVFVSGDPDRLVDIFAHLLQNALKYSPGGGQVSVIAREEDGRTVVTVRDRGIGIEDEHIPLIFDRFYRVESDATSSVGGSGLGLFLVNSLVRAHGGTIEVRSEPGAGSAFTVSLPVRE